MMFTKMLVTNYKSVPYGARTRNEIIKQLRLCVFWKVKTPYKHLNSVTPKIQFMSILSMRKFAYTWFILRTPIRIKQHLIKKGDL